MLLGEQRHMFVNNLPRVATWSERPGLKPATYWLQVRRPNHYATTPHIIIIHKFVRRSKEHWTWRRRNTTVRGAVEMTWVTVTVIYAQFRLICYILEIRFRTIVLDLRFADNCCLSEANSASTVPFYVSFVLMRVVKLVASSIWEVCVPTAAAGGGDKNLRSVRLS